MDVYLFQSALYCTECAEALQSYLRALRVHLKKSVVIDPEDSEKFPVGPYSEGGGEADYPVHCYTCNEFLENYLTNEGNQYVIKAVKEGKPDSVAHTVWKPFYDYLFDVEHEE